MKVRELENRINDLVLEHGEKVLDSDISVNVGTQEYALRDDADIVCYEEGSEYLYIGKQYHMKKYCIKCTDEVTKELRKESEEIEGVFLCRDTEYKCDNCQEFCTKK